MPYRAQTYPPTFRHPQPCSLHCSGNAGAEVQPCPAAKWLKIVPHVIDTVLIGLGVRDGISGAGTLCQRMVNGQTGWARGLYWPWNRGYQAWENNPDQRLRGGLRGWSSCTFWCCEGTSSALLASVLLGSARLGHAPSVVELKPARRVSTRLASPGSILDALGQSGVLLPPTCSWRGLDSLTGKHVFSR